MLNLVNLVLAYGGPPLLDKASLEILPGDRLALVGRNGSGKSSLLKVVSREIEPDDGERVLVGDPCIATLPQRIPDHSGKSVEEVLKSSLKGHTLEHWEIEARIDKALRELGIDADATYSTLSSGQKRQVLLQGCLVQEPDLILLDEPTNHLDAETILWMEDVLLKYRGAELRNELEEHLKTLPGDFPL
jgi:ATP-binding cassette subfamily F protein uup